MWAKKSCFYIKHAICRSLVSAARRRHTTPFPPHPTQPGYRHFNFPLFATRVDYSAPNYLTSFSCEHKANSSFYDGAHYAIFSVTLFLQWPWLTFGANTVFSDIFNQHSSQMTENLSHIFLYTDRINPGLLQTLTIWITSLQLQATVRTFKWDVQFHSQSNAFN